MCRKIICPVCGKKKNQASASKYDCDYCGASNVFVQFFVSQKGYDVWKKRIRLAVEKYENDMRSFFTTSCRLSVGSNEVFFLDVNKSILYIVLGNGLLHIEKDVVQFDSNERNYAVLYKNGKVKVFGDDNEFGQKNTDTWRNIKYITTAPNCTYGISENGSIVYSGMNMYQDILKWRNLNSLKSSDEYILGIHNSGKISISTPIISGIDIKEIENWRDMKDIIPTRTCIFGLSENGSVKYAGKVNDLRNQCRQWKDIIAIAADNMYIYGLTQKGTVCLAGECRDFLDRGRSGVKEWRNIITISCNKSGIGAITSEGELLFAGTISGDRMKIRENWRKYIQQMIINC